MLFLGTAEYARKETAGGALVAAGGAVRISALRGGVITDLMVKEGDRVAAGQPLFTVASRQGLEAGGTLDSAVLASLETQIAVLKEQIAADPARVGERDPPSGCGDCRRQRRSGMRSSRSAASWSSASR